jgi:hypothetical protein
VATIAPYAPTALVTSCAAPIDGTSCIRAHSRSDQSDQREAMHMNHLGGTRPQHGMSREECDEMVRDLQAAGIEVRPAALH